MRWPRGRYNGEPKTGFSIKIKIDLWYWQLVPTARWNYGNPTFGWLCLRVWREAVFSGPHTYARGLQSWQEAAKPTWSWR